MRYLGLIVAALFLSFRRGAEATVRLVLRTCRTCPGSFVFDGFGDNIKSTTPANYIEDDKATDRLTRSLAQA